MYDTDALTPRATIPQRLDRLPLTWTLWRLGLVTQAGWALVVATDAIAARIYPIHLEPRHAFDTAAFSILLLVSTGVGIVAGEYFFALLSDRFGRRRTRARLRSPAFRPVRIPVITPVGVAIPIPRVSRPGVVEGQLIRQRERRRPALDPGSAATRRVGLAELSGPATTSG